MPVGHPDVFGQPSAPKKSKLTWLRFAVPVLVVVIGGESYPEGGYDSVSMSGRISYKLCLMPNVKQGDCLKGYVSQTAGYQKVSCSDPAKDAELVKIANVSDEASCEGTEAKRVPGEQGTFATTPPSGRVGAAVRRTVWDGLRSDGHRS
ncbi:hypothetical protein ACFQ73_02885 [Amycolatopsis japonica]|uniref:hypothetical protein n=1 Tax=Amycolatopsis japonica TaxID=208439 RepID=UPI0036722097